MSFGDATHLSLTDQLNPPQLEAVYYGEGPLLVFAGAGSGKTRVITYRIAHLIAERGVWPSRIWAVTFTNKAASEMRQRIERLVGPERVPYQVGTFHASCARWLRRYADRLGIRQNFTIYDDSDQRALVQRVVREMQLDDRRYPARRLQWGINRAKQEGLGPDGLSEQGWFADVLKRVYATYERRMRAASALDFSDLLWKMLLLLEREPDVVAELRERIHWVLVDEFQDTNRVQYALVRAIVGERRNLCVVGDDDQSIYRWRGADRRNLLDFRRDYPEARIVKLEQNYRSFGHILRAAHAIIARCSKREPKRLWTDRAEGELIDLLLVEDEREEARWVLRAMQELHDDGIPYREMAVFYRINAQSRVFEEVLRAARVPYVVVGGMRFYERAEIKDVLGYLRLLVNPDNDVDLVRVINTPPRGIGKTTIERLLARAHREGTSAFSALGRSLADSGDLSAPARRKLAEFHKLLIGWQSRPKDLPPLAIAEIVLAESGYRAALEAEDDAEADARLENLRELLGSISEFETEAAEPTLTNFLELVTLQTAGDEQSDEDRVTLLTVHAAKGLEFRVVFVTGLEEDVFPYRRMGGGDGGDDDPEEDLEEERRLCYVAITRAKERLVLSCAARRRLFGTERVGAPSRFLAELPHEIVRERPIRARAPAYGSVPAPPRLPTGLPKSMRLVVVPDPETADPDAPFRAGMRVRHARFGVGQVRRYDAAGMNPKVLVVFPGWGEKKIDARYVEPA